MREKKQETELKLSKTQVQSVINDQLQKERGLNDLFEMMINGLMLSERKTFLKDQKIEGIKGMVIVRPSDQGSVVD